MCTILGFDKEGSFEKCFVENEKSDIKLYVHVTVFFFVLIFDYYICLFVCLCGILKLIGCGALILLFYENIYRQTKALVFTKKEFMECINFRQLMAIVVS